MGFFAGAMISNLPKPEGSPPPPEFMGWFFGVFGLGIFTLFVAAAVLKFLCAYRLKARRSRTLCLIVGALSCFALPYGMALGVATFLVLLRPSVARQFSAAPPGAASGR